ncbi:MAG: DNA-binding transcriptional regulator Fis [Halopseudomonas sp.]
MSLLNASDTTGTEPVSELAEKNLNSAPDKLSQSSRTLRNSVEQALKNYFDHLDGQDVTDVYDMVLCEVEAPLLESVMEHVKGNQTRASEILGLNRGTLRKKLKQYGLL